MGNSGVGEKGPRGWRQVVGEGKGGLCRGGGVEGVCGENGWEWGVWRGRSMDKRKGRSLG